MLELLLPAHIMFLELIINPACSILFEAEPEEPNAMRRPPRDPAERLFGGKIMLGSVLQGIAALAVTVTAYAWSLNSGALENEARAQVFAVMVMGNFALIFSNRSLDSSGDSIMRRHNPAFWWMILSACAGLTLVLVVPVLSKLFHFSGDAIHILGIAVLAACALMLFSTAIKRIL
ncbi:MAG: cation transporting ATPase C-terminal domain-containing protein [Nitrosomonadales bacterium]|nr:cation transporting ATPase C-terminal domain-containing protein [Nitrosomonadales bacterium]